MEIPTESRLVRVRLVRDLRGIWGVPATRADKTDPSDIIGIDWSGAELERHPIEEFLHDFLDLEDGTPAFLNSDSREQEGVELIGNVVTEIKLETVETDDIFSTYDLWQPHVEATGADGQWSGGNAMDIDADCGTYTLGFRQLGGPASDYTYAKAADETGLQHQFQWEGDRALVFDNRESGEDSRVIEHARDGTAATPVWTYVSDPPVWVFTLGDVDRNDEGSTFIDWAAAGVFSQG